MQARGLLEVRIRVLCQKKQHHLKTKAVTVYSDMVVLHIDQLTTKQE